MACRPPFEGACSRDNCGMEIPMTARRILGAHVAFLGAMSVACAGERSTAPPLTSPSFSLQAAPSQFYEQHSLVSDGAVSADLVDPALVRSEEHTSELQSHV